MNSATIAVPTRWQPAIYQIKQFVEHYAGSHGLAFDIVFTFQLDSGQMYITDDSLTEFERQVCQNAISAVSDQMNANLSEDVWQARSDLTKELHAQLREISDLVDREAPPSI